MSLNVAYTASSTSTGDGRNGHVTSSDGRLDFDVKFPKEMGGPGGATNPEQLFSAGWAACFHQAVRNVAKEMGLTLSGDSVKVDVGIGQDEAGNFGLAGTITGSLPGLTQAQADEVMEKSHQMCPYSRATRGNVDVAVSATV